MNIGKIGPSFTGFLTLNLENMDEGGSRRERLNTNNIIRIKEAPGGTYIEARESKPTGSSCTLYHTEMGMDQVLNAYTAASQSTNINIEV